MAGVFEPVPFHPKKLTHCVGSRLSHDCPARIKKGLKRTVSMVFHLIRPLSCKTVFGKGFIVSSQGIPIKRYLDIIVVAGKRIHLVRIKPEFNADPCGLKFHLEIEKTRNLDPDTRVK